MKTTYFLSAILVQVVATLAATLGGQSPGDDNSPALIVASTQNNIYSNHIPFLLAPLNMTTGELKLFAGHSIQFLKAKCPAVSKVALSQINKYISKLVSKTNPVPERSQAVDKLLSSISSCAMRENGGGAPADEEVPRQRETSFFHSFLTPFITIKGFFTTDDKEVETATDKASTDAIVVDNNQITEAEEKKEAEAIAATGKPKVSESSPSLGKKDDDSGESDEAQEQIPLSSASEQRPVVPSSSEKRDSDSAPRTSQSQTPFSSSPSFIPFVNIDDGAEDASGWSPTGWIQSIFLAVRDYFRNLFGGSGPIIITGGPEEFGIGPERVKREVSGSDSNLGAERTMKYESVDDEILLTKQLIDKLNAANAASYAADNNGKKEQGKGKQAFLQIMDTLCRVYCSECARDTTQVINIKAAAKALLQFVYTDETGVELAAKHYIDQAFLNALDEC